MRVEIEKVLELLMQASDANWEKSRNQDLETLDKMMYMHSAIQLLKAHNAIQKNFPPEPETITRGTMPTQILDLPI